MRRLGVWAMTMMNQIPEPMSQVASGDQERVELKMVSGTNFWMWLVSQGFLGTENGVRNSFEKLGSLFDEESGVGEGVGEGRTADAADSANDLAGSPPFVYT